MSSSSAGSTSFSRRSTMALSAEFLVTDCPRRNCAAAGHHHHQVHQHLVGSRSKCTCRYLWNTELHGLTAFLKSRTLAERVLWGAIIAACLLMSVLTTEWMFDDYLDRQTATLITIQGEGNRGLKMPILVLCPKNPDSLKYERILRDIGRRLPRLDRLTAGYLIRFAVAGAGLTNVEPFLGRRRFVSDVSDGQLQRLYSLFRRWQGARSLTQFYKDLFESNGYKCTDFLQKCFYGYQEFNCCDLFIPYYVILRGRCLRMSRPLHQVDPSDSGRILVYLNQMSSRLIEPTGMQPQSVAYMSDEFAAVGTFPRYYVHYHSAVLLRAKNRHINMLPGNSQCQHNPQDKGRNSCWLRRWLKEKFLEPYNCTVFYLGRKAFHTYPVCDPLTVVRNYKKVIDLRLDNDIRKRCLPACNRTEHLFQEFRPKVSVMKRHYIPAFLVEVSFTHLEVELYQEVLTTTLPGFVSQLGGQSGLFVGLSVCSIIQIFISLVWKCHRWAHFYIQRRKRRKEEGAKANCGGSKAADERRWTTGISEEEQ